MADSPPPAPSLAMLCYSLGTQAMIALGLAPNPATGESTRDLAAAKYTIDLIEMLREKTEGNRTDEETKVIRALLFDLRMRYVEASKGGPAKKEAETE